MTTRNRSSYINTQKSVESLVIDIPTEVINHIEQEYCQGYKLKSRESVKAWISDLVKRAAIVNYKTSQREMIHQKFINKERGQ